jgi:protein-disulfide isomerase
MGDAKPAYAADWKDLLAGALWIGAPKAAVTIIEFGDFQCPYCATFHETVTRAIAKSNGAAALAYVHLPLPMHKHAPEAARAAECASHQGRFSEIATVMFANQNRIGATPFAEFADQAGVSDRARFRACMHSDSVAATFAAAQSASRKFTVGSTPTIFINGWRLPMPPDEALLGRYIREFASGRSPFGSGDK